MRNLLVILLLLLGFEARAAFTFPSSGSSVGTSASSFGTTGNGIVLNDVVSTSGSAIITSASATWSSADVGKVVFIYNGVYYGTKTATVSSGSPTITSLTTNGLLIGMFVGGYGIVTNTTILAFPSSTSATLSQNANASLVGGILGFTPTYTVTTISSIQSANQVTLVANATFTGTGVRMIYGTDNTTAIQNAINSISTLGGTIVFGPGLHVIAGPLLNASAQNSVLTVPTTANTIISIVFEGTGPTGRGQNGNFAKPSTLSGTVLFCPTAGPGALFGGSANSGVTPVTMDFRDLSIRMPWNPTLSAITAYNGGGLITHNVLVEADEVNHAQATLPAHPTIAIIGPNDQNGAIFELYDTDVQGFGAGVGSSYHSTLHNCQLAVNRKGISMIGQGLGIIGCTFVGNQQDIVNDGTQNNRLDAVYCRFEDHIAAGGENFVSTATFNEDPQGVTAQIYGEVFGMSGRAPVNLSATSGLNIHWVNLTGGSPYLTHYNPGTISQKLYTDYSFISRVAGDTSGMQFKKSDGTQAGFIAANENFNQFFCNSAGAFSLILKSAGGGMTVGTGGIVTFDSGIASTLNATAAPSSISVTASPFTYLNNSGKNQTIFLDANGATVSVTMNGGAIFSSIAASDRLSIPMQSGATIVVTYSVATPLMKSMSQ